MVSNLKKGKTLNSNGKTLHYLFQGCMIKHRYWKNYLESWLPMSGFKIPISLAFLHLSILSLPFFLTFTVSMSHKFFHQIEPLNRAASILKKVSKQCICFSWWLDPMCTLLTKTVSHNKIIPLIFICNFKCLLFYQLFKRLHNLIIVTILLDNILCQSM